MSSKKHEDDEAEKKAHAKEVQEHDAAKGRSALAPNQPVAEHTPHPDAVDPSLNPDGTPKASVAPPAPGPSPDPPPHGSPSERERYAEQVQVAAAQKAEAALAARTKTQAEIDAKAEADEASRPRKKG
jgi:hypothetical protein